MFLVPDGDREADAKASPIPALPVQYIRSSDVEIVAAHKAASYDQAQLSSDRREGKFVISYETPGGWVGITKDILTDVLGAGNDVKIVGLPAAAADALTLMCPALVALPENAPP